jgi:hypothetical protein
MHRTLASLSLIIVLLAGALGGARPAAAQPAPPAPPVELPAGDPEPLAGEGEAGSPTVAPAAPGLALPQAAIPCDSSPFGRVLVIGGEREIFASYRGAAGSAQANRVLFDRLDLSGAALSRSFASTAAEAALQGVTAPAAATVADVDGDGAMELVQVFNDAAGNLRTATHFRDGSALIRQFPLVNHSQIQAATLSRGTNGFDRVVVATRSGTGALSIVILDVVGETINNIYRSNTDGRQNLSDLRLALADLDNDGSRDDIGVAFREELGGAAQLLVVTPANVPATGSGSNFILNMRLVDFEQIAVGTPMSLALAAGDLNGDYRDELIYAQEQQSTSSPGVSEGLATLAYSLAKDGSQLVPYLTRNETARTAHLALATGDTDRDGRDELVRAYRDFSNNSALVVETLDAEQGAAVVVRNRYQEAAGARATFDALALDVGDMDKDGFDDIAAGVRDRDGQLNIVRLEDSELPLGGIALGGELRDGSNGRTQHSGLVLRIGDYDDDSIKAHYEAASGSALICQQVIEPQLSAAVFAPPHWKAIQGDQDQLGVIGESSTVAKSTESSVSTTQSHSVSAYIGFEIDAEVVEFSAKVTGGYERSATTTRTNGTTTSDTISTARSNVEGNFVLVENARYNCYSYQVKQDDVSLDGQMRFCDYQGRTIESPSLDSWDIQNGQNGSVKSRTWAPVTRDWANLALFVSTPPVQSSTASGGVATRASDGTLSPLPADTAVTRTNSEAAPWWQIDLDEEQPVSKVRVWNRSNTECGGLGCPAPLANFHVFVASVDPRTISNDPNVLKADPRVKSFFFSGNAANVANILTLGTDLEPVTGRFVRVQLAGTGVLSLAEVQVFGTNHVDPHRYPVGISDPVAGDGFFTVKLFDPRSETIVDVQTRGNLAWNGTNTGLNVLPNERIGSGGGQTSWSIAKDLTTSSAEAVSVENAYKVGVEFEFAGGVINKVTAGVGYEFSSGVGEETVRSLEVTKGFEVGGTVTGFPTRVDGRPVLWPEQCGYGLQPYYYEVTEVSSAGYAHRYLVLDYIVPELSLDRTANMGACQVARDGGPSLESNFTQGAPGSLFVLTAQGFTAGSTASIQMRGPGAPQFNEIASLKLNNDGALVFALLMPETAVPGDYEVQIVGGQTTAGSSLAQAATVRSVTLRVEPQYALRDEEAPSAPVVQAPQTSYYVRLPLVTR